jgi:cyclic beta-1,2-glucan synthetase
MTDSEMTKMQRNSNFATVSNEAEALPQASLGSGDRDFLRARASEFAQTLVWLPNTPSSETFPERCAILERAYPPIFAALQKPVRSTAISDDSRWLYDNERLLATEVQSTVGELRSKMHVPHVRTPDGTVSPRALALARGYLRTVGYEFVEQEFVCFVETFQETTVLQSQELRLLVPSLKLLLLERIAVSAKRIIRNPADDSQNVGVAVRSLQDVGHTPWKETLETLVVIDRILRRDPAGAYGQMDSEGREYYRKRITFLAEHSDCPEVKVAERVLALAEQAGSRTHTNPRIALRESHVGYYLVDQGKRLLEKEVGFRTPFKQKVQRFLKDHPDEFFVVGIAVVTLAITSVAALWLTEYLNSLAFILLALLILLLPSSQSAVQLMNFLVTSILPPEILPKLDFEDVVPDDCVTMVAVPSLLLSENQVRGLVENLEVRFLGNHDPNIHFALLTDLPDSREPAREDSPLVTLCSSLIEKLNEKYASRKMGSFFLFHRHRVYNPREKVWMGWERKRGKLLDLNKLLRGLYDSFPVKVGDLSVLPEVRFVITLDSDTELPRGTAQRLIGTLAHPLNQAIVDPEKNIVVAGYGILQPRVGVSVQSTARSRLAAIYAGETGFDIYTRAISDAYQDLYGEGSFTGKGIYEVDSILRVLDKRFPRNSLLSHDLIEGAYARAGLASDIEVIEDYPSHYSAWNRRKHRWLRGDWQIAGWLFPMVPSESLERVPNPISLLSRWKIFDNLRRSLVEPATFLLLVAGWFLFGEPWQWTVAALLILFLPTLFQFFVDLVRAISHLRLSGVRDSIAGFFTASVNVVFTLIFLPHQMLLSLDAVVRALVRRFVTQRRLLEWETAAEAELATQRRGPVDIYLNWTPVLALGIAVLVWAIRPHALPVAIPICVLWASSKLVAYWLNQSPIPARKKASSGDVRFLRETALRTWRYFAEFSTAEHHWLIPDNVQEEPFVVAARVSPTNIGLLLNARQVACEFGYLTAPELAERTKHTLETISGLRKYRGHLLNWYDTRTLESLAPRFVSSVDSGNLLASLWTLQQGALECLRQPVLQPCLAEGFLDYLRLLARLRVLPRKVVSNFEHQSSTDQWLTSILSVPEDLFARAAESADAGQLETAKWFMEEAGARLASIRKAVCEYAPWFSPEYAEFRSDPALNAKLLDTVSLEQLPEFIEKLTTRVNWAAHSGRDEQRRLGARFLDHLLAARENALRLISGFQELAAMADQLAEQMDFTFLVNARRKLLSVGFDTDHNRLEPACYDLLASESRTAAFVAIAKEDVPQETWFLLGRAHTLDEGRPVLLSWSGTAFEYLMPSLWMRTYYNTLLERSRVAAVRSQQMYGDRKGVPWGISESAHAKLDDAGNYGYYAFGLPHLALHKGEVDSLVISPYSTLLGLSIDPEAAVANLRRMAGMGWVGSYGFYEGADYSAGRRRFWRSNYQIVRCWMAHHQGMSMLALANFLDDNVVQKWFHAEPRVQASELLLHEKPVAHVMQIPHRPAVA